MKPGAQSLPNEAFPRFTCHRCGLSFIAPAKGLVICQRCETQLSPRSLDAPKFLIDNVAYDYLARTDERLNLCIDAHVCGAVEFLVTHVQHGEMLNNPDAALRTRVFSIPFVIVATYGMKLGISKPGLARYGEPELITAVDSEQEKHTPDALQASTAKFEEATLITFERRLTNQAKKIGVEVWAPPQLVEFIAGLLSAG